jgi:hypothetical protein
VNWSVEDQPLAGLVTVVHTTSYGDWWEEVTVQEPPC